MHNSGRARRHPGGVNRVALTDLPEAVFEKIIKALPPGVSIKTLRLVCKTLRSKCNTAVSKLDAVAITDRQIHNRHKYVSLLPSMLNKLFQVTKLSIGTRNLD
eukprot:jgi/Botrbrau1/19964/Bobra.0059s0080.1